MAALLRGIACPGSCARVDPCSSFRSPRSSRPAEAAPACSCPCRRRTPPATSTRDDRDAHEEDASRGGCPAPARCPPAAAGRLQPVPRRRLDVHLPHHRVEQPLQLLPAHRRLHPIGTINCPDLKGEEPFSMGVDRSGIAYIVFSANAGGELFRVSTATGACVPTNFGIGQQGFARTFGMGFSADPVDGGETLYVASDHQHPALASIDMTSFVLHSSASSTRRSPRRSSPGPAPGGSSASGSRPPPTTPPSCRSTGRRRR